MIKKSSSGLRNVSTTACTCLITAESPNLHETTEIPEMYQEFKEVFSKAMASSLLPHRPYDCAIDFNPGTHYTLTSNSLWKTAFAPPLGTSGNLLSLS